MDSQEAAACIPVPINQQYFNPQASIPYGLTTQHISQAMTDFQQFLHVVNTQLNSQGMVRLESLLMPANFSSIVSEFMNVTLPRYCPTLVKNMHHNGHPDLIPQNTYPDNAIQHGQTGIEVKASRYLRNWQGHNPEESWLLVFIFDCNRPNDTTNTVPPKPFRFVKVVGAQLQQSDWSFAGRSDTSRRTITASVTASGFAKMEANWIYSIPQHLPESLPETDEEDTLN